MTPQFLTPTTPSESRMVDVGDISLHVRRYDGNGPEVLLIHGITSSARDFDPVIDGLADAMTPITVDLRGHGESEKPATGYHYDDYARDLVRLLDALGMDEPIILGHSLGGILTLWWAMAHPSAGRALIIEDAPLRSGADFGSAFDGWQQLNALPFEGAREYYATQNPGWPQHLVDTRAWDITHTEPAAIAELRAASMANEGLDSRDGMRDIASPTLFIHGDPDAGSMVHPDDVAALPERLSAARIVRIPGGSHSMHRNRIPEWLETVNGFMKEMDG